MFQMLTNVTKIIPGPKTSNLVTQIVNKSITDLSEQIDTLSEVNLPELLELNACLL